MLRVATSTIGCKVNQYETETILRDFKKRGFEIVNSSEDANIYIVNTCSVTKNSDRKSRQAIRRAVRNAQGLRAKSDSAEEQAWVPSPQPGSPVGEPLAHYVVVTGCYAQKSPETVSRIPGIDLVVLNEDKPRLADMVAQKSDLSFSDSERDSNLCNSIRQVAHTRALVKVQDGCDNYCSYCVVPYLRGRPASRRIEEIINEICRLGKGGAKEVVLTGINLGKYGKDLDSDASLLRLLTKLVDISGIVRIRLSSIELGGLTAELVEFISNSSKICNHLHIPLQNGSDRILSLMGRNYEVADYLDTVEKLKARIPALGLTTDVMVGFPGESEKDFRDTISVVKKAGFSKLHVFRFSPREGTKAATLPNQVSRQTKLERSRELTRIGSETRHEFLQGFEGKNLEVLVEKEKDGQLSGLTSNYIRVVFEGPTELEGEVVLAKSISANGEYLWGELLGPSSK